MQCPAVLKMGQRGCYTVYEIGSIITLLALRDGTLLTAPRKMPLTSSACFFVCAVRCAPAPGRSALNTPSSPPASSSAR